MYNNLQVSKKLEPHVNNVAEIFLLYSVWIAIWKNTDRYAYRTATIVINITINVK